MTSGEVPVGRRVAQWRIRRRMTQQMLADRLGKSKSWVDKVERGVRSLDRFSVIQDVARVLRVEPATLVGRESRPAGSVDVEGVEGLRAALARYDLPRAATGSAAPTPDLGRRVEHAWSAYQHARHAQVMRLVPDLLDAARRAHAAGGGHGTTGLLVRVYRITASVLVKLGEPDVAWLAADRAVAVAAGDPGWTAVAAVPLGQALRATGRGRLATMVTIAAANRIAAAHDRSSAGPTLGGTLWVEAALAAASCGDAHSAAEWLGLAAEIAGRVDDRHDPHLGGFGPATVQVAHVAAAVELGDGGEAVARHEAVIGTDGWRRLPVEHRAAHLVDAARAYLQIGDLLRAGRALTEADRIAPDEIRMRPLARTVIGEVARGGPAPAGVSHLTTAIGLTRRAGQA
ncbi:helix-turn-helix domain-containing protein [Micromonospora sp. WMMD1128]|uniref:helix-turn-helix domain-containing protein n=1 Tax=Micromonospora sp. WMMD1128 TaxID=3015150 RepID=UPI00248BAC1D|nr:helix-turn-helix domain-containing protein [Micromonospora sp. WMMD1128]WBB76353.1 helix-turn-helix domain-containing protein [Micromonospora sp. WMMD1128]